MDVLKEFDGDSISDRRKEKVGGECWCLGMRQGKLMVLYTPEILRDSSIRSLTMKTA